MSSMEDATDTYVALKPCGCVSAATVDSPERKREVARTVAGYIRDGLRVERITSESFRAGEPPLKCGVCKPEVAEQLELGVS